jgi:lytic murein transglycosylase
VALSLILAILFTRSVNAAACGNSSDGFAGWLDEFQAQASGEGISSKTLSAAFDNVAYDRTIISRDRDQKVFHLSFEKFSKRIVTPSRLSRGRDLLHRNSTLLRKIEDQYGVPGPVLIAIWGLETGFGADNGHFRTTQALATLAYDCRRTETFKDELKDALIIIERGDVPASQMRGDWAGEIGQTQFMPSSYLKYAVDFDRDGRRDLIRSPADALASTANYLKGKGWQAGAGWSEGEPNFPVFLEWNKASVYAKTIAYFATKLSEAPTTGN